MKILMTLGIMIMIFFTGLGVSYTVVKSLEYLEDNHQHVIDKIKNFLIPIIIAVFIFSIYFAAIYSML